MPFESNPDSYTKATRYQLLADYYKYSDPTKHIYYYQKHYQHLYSWIQQQSIRNVSDHIISKVRVLHGAPKTSTIDVYINKELILRGLRYKNSSEYLEIPAGSYQVEITVTDKASEILSSSIIDVAQGIPYTLAALNANGKTTILPINDNEQVPPGETKVRFLHLSPTTPKVDIAVKKGDIIFSDLEYRNVTDYLPLTPMTVDFEIRLSGTKDVLMSINRVNVKPDLAYTIAVVGLLGETPKMEAIFLVP
ncbi:DUF4397 domain-containing protein [Bacillus tianshenii]|uniref:DUF4397 domain-containing protein n=1 Tax=Sutcliffiella tianshenii TaxID=1463404 RepID=UPI001CD483D6|nr:DUF4397 domain-containing protein [Bacillus tianshenii]MCA1321113.1 DUF4397 domain-containing protein [Bacillus tianshenii]